MRLDPETTKPRNTFYGVTFTRAPLRMLPLLLRSKIGSQVPKLIEWKFGDREELIGDIPTQTARLLDNLSYQENNDDMEAFIDRLGSAWNPVKIGLTNFNPFNFVNSVYYFYLYSLVRKLRPRVAVEAGVFVGGSSAAILKAMEDNGTGKLISADISETVPLGMRTKHEIPTGAAVPESLRPRWELVIRDSHQFLPEVLPKLGSIDLYLHDSEHTYETMKFEMELAWKYLKTAGVMVVDDANLSMAVYDFAKEQHARPWLLSRDGVYPDSLAIFLK